MIVTLEHRDSISIHDDLDTMVIRYGGQIYRISERNGALVLTAAGGCGELTLKVLSNAVQLGVEERR